MSDTNPKPTDAPAPTQQSDNTATKLPTSASHVGYDSDETGNYHSPTTPPEQAQTVNTTGDATRNALRGAMDSERGAARDAKSQTDATPAGHKPKEEATSGAASNTEPLSNS